MYVYQWTEQTAIGDGAKDATAHFKSYGID